MAHLSLENQSIAPFREASTVYEGKLPAIAFG